MTRILTTSEVGQLVTILRNARQARFNVIQTEETIVVTWQSQRVFSALLKDPETWIVWYKDDLFVPPQPHPH